VRALRRRRASRVDRVEPLQFSGLVRGVRWARGAGLSSGLTAEPAPLASLVKSFPCPAQRLARAPWRGAVSQWRREWTAPAAVVWRFSESGPTPLARTDGASTWPSKNRWR
jgi:hypothetical protein